MIALQIGPDTLILLLAGSVALAAIGGALFSPPDPFTQLRYAAWLFVALAVHFYIPAFRGIPFVGDA